jgi:hypothetical protein
MKLKTKIRRENWPATTTPPFSLICLAVRVSVSVTARIHDPRPGGRGSPLDKFICHADRRSERKVSTEAFAGSTTTQKSRRIVSCQQNLRRGLGSTQKGNSRSGAGRRREGIGCSTPLPTSMAPAGCTNNAGSGIGSRESSTTFPSSFRCPSCKHRRSRGKKYSQNF